MTAIRHLGLREMFFSLMQDAVLEATETWQRQLAGYKKDDKLRWKEFLEDLEKSHKRTYTRAETGLSNLYTASLVSQEAFDEFLTAIHPYLSPATESRLTQYVTKRFLNAEQEWRESAKKITPISKIIDEVGADITLKELENGSAPLLSKANKAMWSSYVSNEYDDVRRIGDAVVVGLLELAKATGRMELFSLDHPDALSTLSMLISTNSKTLPVIARILTSPRWVKGMVPPLFNNRVVFLTLTDRLEEHSDRSIAQLKLDERTLQMSYLETLLPLTKTAMRDKSGVFITQDRAATQIALLEGMRYRAARIKENKAARIPIAETCLEIREEFRTGRHELRHLASAIEFVPAQQIYNEINHIAGETTIANPFQLATLETALARTLIVEFTPNSLVNFAADALVRAYKCLIGLDHNLAEADFYGALSSYMRATGYTRAEIRAANIAEMLVRQSGDKKRANLMKLEEDNLVTEPNLVPAHPRTSAHDLLMSLLLPTPKEKGPHKPRKRLLTPPEQQN